MRNKIIRAMKNVIIFNWQQLTLNELFTRRKINSVARRVRILKL